MITNEVHPIPVSNKDSDGNYIDRIYGGLNDSCRLVQQDGSTYQGAIKKKTIILKSITDGSRYKSHCYVTDDNRWFDRSGMPTLPPENIEVEEDKENEQMDRSL